MAYIGSAEDARRIRKQEEEREKQRKEFEERKRIGESNIDGAGLREFGAGSAEVLEAAFKNETVGLVTREEFLNKRNTLKARLEEEEERAKRKAEEEAAVRRAERQKKKQRTEAKSKLSFAEDEEASGEDAEPAATEGTKAVAAVNAAGSEPPLGRLGKNPHAETDFLPDRDRDKQEAELRKQIEKEYEIREQVLKSEPLEITYSYFDGSGHRRVLTAKRGDTVLDFLKKVREQLAPDFVPLRSISLSNLLFVKEDVILPPEVSFHDLIKRRARGKTGPLFDFSVRDDVRAHSDSRIKAANDTHAGKIVTRTFYERNKHIFPASKWERLPEDF